MSAAVCFAAFLAAMIACVIVDISTLWALGLGIALFAVLGLKRGFSVKQMACFAWNEGKKLVTLLIIFMMIGSLTGLWRSGGTIAWCIYYGTQIIRPKLFILVAFCLTCVLSYALGTSFGVCGTAGIILMALARSGGVSVPLTAGTVLAGAYFGDRCSPASSSALLVAAVTKTKQYDNVKMMHKTALLPMTLSLAAYGVLSCRNPLGTLDDVLLTEMGNTFSLGFWAVLPAIIMLILPLCKVPIRWALTASSLAAFIVSVAVQKLPVGETVLVALRGYHGQGTLAEILSGGGVLSMLSCAVTVMTTGLLAGLLEGLHVFDGVKDKLDNITEKIGLFPTMLFTSTAAAALFCNQSIAVMMGESFLRDSYHARNISPEEEAIDLENSGIITAPLIPWNIAGSIPIAMMGSDARAIPYAILLYLIPICYLFTKRWFYPKEVNKK